MTTIAAGRLGATSASVSAYFIPVVALLLGVLVRNEHVATAVADRRRRSAWWPRGSCAGRRCGRPRPRRPRWRPAHAAAGEVGFAELPCAWIRCRSTRTSTPSSMPCAGTAPRSSWRRPAPARPRGCRRRSPPTGRCWCCSRGGSRRGPSRAASPRSAAGRSARRSAGTCASSAGSRRRRASCSRPKASSPRACVDDPLISGVRTIVLDEFHERSIHADLGLALARQAWTARDDLRVVVMSATLAAEPVARFLDGCPIVDVPGRPHPLDDRLRARRVGRRCGARGAGPARAAACCASCPARPRSAAPTARSRSAVPDAEVVDLFGGLTAEEQDRAVRGDRSGRGPARDPRHQHRRDVAHRARRRHGRGHRAAQGRPLRCDAGPRHARHRARVRRPAPISGPAAPPASGPGAPAGCGTPAIGCAPHGEPDIARIDLAGPLLDLAAWGDRSRGVRLVRGAAGGGRGRGAPAAAAPRRPRRQRADAARPADAGAAAAAAAGPHPDRGGRRPRRGAGLRDPLGAPARAGPPRGDDVRPARLARRVGVAAAARAPGGAPDRGPGRGARRRRTGAAHAPSPRRTCGGRCSSATPIAWPGAARRRARRWCWRPGPAPSSAARAASATASSWSRSTSRRRPRPGRSATRWSASRAASSRSGSCRPRSPSSTPSIRAAGRVRAWRRERFDRLVLAEHAQAPEPGRRGARSLAEAWLARRRRTRPTPAGSAASAFAGLDVDLPALVRQAARRRRVAGRDRSRARTRRTRWRASSIASRRRTCDLPSGRRTALDLRGRRHRLGVGQAAGAVRAGRDAARRAVGRAGASCRCWRRTGGRCRPRATCAASGIARIPRSARELRGRYPRHPWPEDPWTATPTAQGQAAAAVLAAPCVAHESPSRTPELCKRRPVQ